MFSSLYEILLCPYHGILRPANWPLIVPVVAGARFYLVSILNKIRG